MTVTWLGFPTTGVTKHTGRPTTEITNFKKWKFFIEFSFICLNNLKNDEFRKSSLFMQNIYFSAHFAAAPWTILSGRPEHPFTLSTHLVRE
jgi:hypothetical protein